MQEITLEEKADYIERIADLIRKGCADVEIDFHGRLAYPEWATPQTITLIVDGIRPKSL